MKNGRCHRCRRVATALAWILGVTFLFGVAGPFPRGRAASAVGMSREPSEGARLARHFQAQQAALAMGQRQQAETSLAATSALLQARALESAKLRIEIEVLDLQTEIASRRQDSTLEGELRDAQSVLRRMKQEADGPFSNAELEEDRR